MTFRFGLMTNNATSRGEWQDRARKVEEAGFDVLLVADHLLAGLAPLTALVSAADVTRSLRLGVNVIGNDFRNPVMLAHETVTTSLLTDGRFELGLGSGWLADDYAWSGISLDPPPERISRLEEAIQVIKAYWSGEPCDFQGRYYRLKLPAERSLPVREFRPPLMVGGGGKRTLKLAARQADIISLNPLTTPAGWLDYSTVTVAATDQKLEWIRQAAGDRLGEKRVCFQFILTDITDRPEEALKQLYQGWGIPEEVLPLQEGLESPMILAGSEAALVEKIHWLHERYGASYFIFYDALEAGARLLKHFR